LGEVEDVSVRAEIEEVDRGEGLRLFDAAARRFLGISGDEFLRRWDAGDFDDDDRPEVTHVALLIPFARDGG
jgi:hypothetical protein